MLTETASEPQRSATQGGPDKTPTSWVLLATYAVSAQQHDGRANVDLVRLYFTVRDSAIVWFDDVPKKPQPFLEDGHTRQDIIFLHIKRGYKAAEGRLAEPRTVESNAPSTSCVSKTSPCTSCRFCVGCCSIQDHFDATRTANPQLGDAPLAGHCRSSRGTTTRPFAKRCHWTWPALRASPRKCGHTIQTGPVL